MGKTRWYVGSIKRGFNTALADDNRRLIKLDAVDQASLEEKPRRLCTALDQKRGNTARRECRQQDFRMIGIAMDDLDAGGFEGCAAGVHVSG